MILKTPPVDLLVNCYEATYRKVLAPGFMEGLLESHCRKFQAVTVLVNNIDDRSDAHRLARRSRLGDAVTQLEFVEDHIDNALDITGLSKKEIRRSPHYTDWALVAVTLPGSEYVLHWDADCRLSFPIDWVTPTVEYLSRNAHIAVANPASWHEGLAEREALFIEGSMAIGYGFSDQVFLAARSELGRRIYNYLAPASWRGPLSAVTPIFEQRVDAYMRRKGRLRATYLPAVYNHDTEFGFGYPAMGRRERLRAAAFSRGGRLAARLSSHPAMRAWPLLDGSAR